MNDERDTAAAFNEGLGPVMEEAQPAPAWESFHSDFGPPSPGNRHGMARAGRRGARRPGWCGVDAPAWSCQAGRQRGAGRFRYTTHGCGRWLDRRTWVLESWEEDGKLVPVEMGINTTGECTGPVHNRQATTAARRERTPGRPDVMESCWGTTSTRRVCLTLDRWTRRRLGASRTPQSASCGPWW